MKELSSLAERQRLSLAEAEHRARELEREASEAKKETRLAQVQVNGGLGVIDIPLHVNTAVIILRSILRGIIYWCIVLSSNDGRSEILFFIPGSHL